MRRNEQGDPCCLAGIEAQHSRPERLTGGIDTAGAGARLGPECRRRAHYTRNKGVTSMAGLAQAHMRTAGFQGETRASVRPHAVGAAEGAACWVSLRRPAAHGGVLCGTAEPTRPGALAVPCSSDRPDCRTAPLVQAAAPPPPVGPYPAERRPLAGARKSCVLRHLRYFFRRRPLCAQAEALNG